MILLVLVVPLPCVDILVGMLKKEKKRAADALSQLESGNRADTAASIIRSSNGYGSSNSVISSQHLTKSHIESEGHRRRPSSGRSERHKAEVEKRKNEKDDQRKTKICKYLYLLIIFKLLS